MELDKRIKDIGTIQTILRYNVNCIGCKGYFFDQFVDIKDLSQNCCYGELVNIITDNHENDHCFKAKLENGNTSFFRFFIPEDALNPVEPEKKYRPYSLAEWVNSHEIGEVIHYRSKSEGVEAHIMYMGTYHHKNKGTIVLGVASYTLDCLFEEFEIEIDGKWQPFGVLDDNK